MSSRFFESDFHDCMFYWEVVMNSLKKKRTGLVICILLLMGIVFQANGVLASQNRAFNPFGSFIGEKPDLLKGAVDTLRLERGSLNTAVLSVNNWPVTLEEIEFRYGMWERSGIGKASYSGVVEKLIAEKSILEYAYQNSILPNDEQVDEILDKEKKQYENDSEFRANIDLFIEDNDMTIDEYWFEYEWYNIYRIVAIDNVYKAAVRLGEEEGVIPESHNIITTDTQGVRVEYWNNFKSSLIKASEIRQENQGKLQLSEELDEALCNY